MDLTKTGLSGFYIGGGEITCTALSRDEILVAVKSNILSYSLKTGGLLHIQNLGNSQVTGTSSSFRESTEYTVKL